MVNMSWNGQTESMNEQLIYNGLSSNLNAVIREHGQMDYVYDRRDQLLNAAYTGSINAPEAMPLLNRAFAYTGSGNRTFDSYYFNHGVQSRSVTTPRPIRPPAFDPCCKVQNAGAF